VPGNQVPQQPTRSIWVHIHTDVSEGTSVTLPRASIQEDDEEMRDTFTTNLQKRLTLPDTLHHEPLEAFRLHQGLGEQELLDYGKCERARRAD